MAQVCLLMAVFMLSSVIGRDIVNLRENKDTDSSMDENVKYQRRQAATTTPQTSNFTCGLRPAIRSKRDDEDEDSDLLDKILGGRNILRGEVPWQVNIYESGHHVCGGAIINEYWIITTAHCISGTNTDLLTVVVGDHNWSVTEQGEETFLTDSVKVHANYSATLLHYNIALLKVKGESLHGSPIRGFSFGDYVQPVCLPTESEVLKEGDELTISGWGIEKYWQKEPSEILKISTIRIGSTFNCSLLNIPLKVTEYTACAWDSNGQANVGRGEHGGPVTFQSKGRAVLGGIISSGDYFFAKTWPVLLTRVVNFVDWIRDVIRDNSSGDESLMPSRPASN